MTIFAWLVGAVGPLAVRVLQALGIAAITYTGVQAVFDAMVSYVQGAWAGMPATMAALVDLSGAGQAAGMVLGAMGSRLAIWLATSATRLAVRGS